MICNRLCLDVLYRYIYIYIPLLVFLKCYLPACHADSLTSVLWATDWEQSIEERNYSGSMTWKYYSQTTNIFWSRSTVAALCYFDNRYSGKRYSFKSHRFHDSMSHSLINAGISFYLSTPWVHVATWVPLYFRRISRGLKGKEKYFLYNLAPLKKKKKKNFLCCILLDSGL